MRLLFLNPVGGLGGAERVLIDCLASLKAALPADSVIRLICLADGDLLPIVRSMGIEAMVLPLPETLTRFGESGLSGGKASRLLRTGETMLRSAPGGVRFIHRLRRAVAEFEPDIIHSNGIKTHLLSRLLPARKASIVWHIHDFVGQRPLMASLLRHGAGRLSMAIAISNAVAADVRQVLPKTPITTVLNGIDTSQFAPAVVDPARLDTLAGLPAGGPGVVRVGLIATYARWKGQDVFLQAIARLRSSLESPARFFIVGGSIYHTAGSQFSRAELQQRADELGLRDTVGFVDFQNDTADIDRALDVVVHASTKPEPFGRTIVEAMACGRATIVSNAGGASELFTDPIDALGTAPGDVDALAGAMKRLIEDAPLRHRLGEAARSTAVARFDRRRLGPELLDVYRQLMAENSAGQLLSASGDR